MASIPQPQSMYEGSHVMPACSPFLLLFLPGGLMVHTLSDFRFFSAAELFLGTGDWTVLSGRHDEEEKEECG